MTPWVRAAKPAGCATARMISSTCRGRGSAARNRLSAVCSGRLVKALMVHFLDIGIGLGQAGGDRGERSGQVAQLDREPGEPAGARTMPRSMMTDSISGSMLPPEHDPRAPKALRMGEQAARPAAPAPSTTVFSISRSNTMACSIPSPADQQDARTRVRARSSVR